MPLSRRLAQFAYLVHYITLLMTLPIMSMGDYSDFDAKECARLHNEMVGLAHGPQSGSTARLVKFFDAFSSEESREPFMDYLSPSLVEFLSDIKIPLGPQNESFSQVTPHLLTPHPAFFFKFMEDHYDDRYPYAILLYREHMYDSDGGLFFDMQTNLCTWINMDNPWPHPDQWYPLEDALGRYAEMFRTEKYHCAPHEFLITECRMEPYVEADVALTVLMYETLLDAIVLRNAGSEIYKTPLVSAEMLKKWHIHGFAYDFLSRANSSSITYIAPGLRPLTDLSFEAIMLKEYGSIDQKDEQVRHSDDVVPLLLFSSDERTSEQDYTVPLDHPAGLYLDPSYHFADEVRLVTPFSIGGNGHIRYGNSPKQISVEDPHVSDWKIKGLDVLYQHGPCPYFGDHSTRLYTLLAAWTNNIQNELFVVGPDGVEGGMELYKLADTPSPAMDFDVGECGPIIRECL